jgi:hypothetical protein
MIDELERIGQEEFVVHSRYKPTLPWRNWGPPLEPWATLVGASIEIQTRNPPHRSLQPNR